MKNKYIRCFISAAFVLVMLLAMNMTVFAETTADSESMTGSINAGLYDSSTSTATVSAATNAPDFTSMKVVASSLGDADEEESVRVNLAREHAETDEFLPGILLALLPPAVVWAGIRNLRDKECRGILELG